MKVRLHALAGAMLAGGIGVCGLLPQAAWALGFGQVRVLSELGQPLNAQVDLRLSAKESIEETVVRHAPASEYEKQGIPFTAGVSGLSVSIKSVDGKPVAFVSTSAPVHTPVLEFVLHGENPQGRVLRAFSVRINSTALSAPSVTPGQHESAPGPIVAAAGAPAALASRDVQASVSKLEASKIYPNVVEVGVRPEAHQLDRVKGAAKQAPVSAVLPKIVPSGWKGFAGDAAVRSAPAVDWVGADRYWITVLDEVMQAASLTATVDWGKKEVTFRGLDPVVDAPVASAAAATPGTAAASKAASPKPQPASNQADEERKGLLARAEAFRVVEEARLNKQAQDKAAQEAAQAQAASARRQAEKEQRAAAEALAAAQATRAEKQRSEQIAREQAQALEQQARARTEAEAKARAQAEAEAKASAQAEAQAEAKARAQAEAAALRQRAQAEIARLRAQEEDRAREEATKKRAQEEQAKARAEAEAKARAQAEAEALRQRAQAEMARVRAQEEAREREAAARSQAQARAAEMASAASKAQAQREQQAKELQDRVERARQERAEAAAAKAAPKQATAPVSEPAPAAVQKSATVAAPVATASHPNVSLFGAAPAPSHLVTSAGFNVSLFSAAQQLIPPGWSLFTQDAALAKVENVSWRGGSREWVVVLGEALAKQGVTAVVNAEKKEVFLKR